jgi:hypothetical protein
MNMIFSVGCDSRIRHRTKDKKNPIFCVVLDAAVASNTENQGLCKQTIKFTARRWSLAPRVENGHPGLIFHPFVH